MMDVFKLRPVDSTDHQWLVELHNDPLVLRNNTDPTPITLHSHLEWWNSLSPTKDKRQIFCVNDERAGFAKIFSIDVPNGNCLLGGDIHPEFRGRGFAKVMWKMMLNEVFHTLPLSRAALTVAEYNAVGHHIYTSLGFKEEGRLIKSLWRDGRRWDQICMYMMREDWTGK